MNSSAPSTPATGSASAAMASTEPRTLAEATDLTRSPEFAGNSGGGLGRNGGGFLPRPLGGRRA